MRRLGITAMVGILLSVSLHGHAQTRRRSRCRWRPGSRVRRNGNWKERRILSVRCCMAAADAAAGAVITAGSAYLLEPLLDSVFVVLRLAELYLIRAEASAQEGRLTEATNDLDTIRVRAALASLPAGLSRDALLAAVAQERRVDFFAEWGHRWSDLKRTGRADAVLAALKPAWVATDVLYPIIATDMARNLSLY